MRRVRPAALLALAGLVGCATAPEAPRAPMTIDGPAGALFVDDGGDGGLPMVLVHSAAGNSTQWAAQLEHLRRQRRAVALDVRGHGRSEPPRDGDYSVAGMAADIGAAADALGLDRFILAGHSMGAAVALEYAASNPDRVAGLLLVDGAGVVPDTSREQALGFVRRLAGDDYDGLMDAYWTQITRGGDSAATVRVFADMRATPQATMVGVMPALIDYDPVSALARYPGARLLVISPIGDNASALHHHVEALPHVLIDDVGHWLQMDRPAEFNAVLDRFIDEVEM